MTVRRATNRSSKNARETPFDVMGDLASDSAIRRAGDGLPLRDERQQAAPLDADKNFGGLYLDDLVSTGKPSLGDPEVGGGLVRTFLAGVVDRVAEVGAGHEDKGVAAMADQRACLAMAAIFLGRDPAYKTVGQWNDGAGLVDWSYEQLRHYYRKPDANLMVIVVDLFAHATLFVYEAVAAHAEKGSRTTCRTIW
jgi:hypothetical protein